MVKTLCRAALLLGGFGVCACTFSQGIDYQRDSIGVPLTSEAGDPVRGRAIVANRRLGLCLLCHSGPIPEQQFQGDLAPDLAGAGDRWSAGQLRLRLVNPARFNPATIMPSYFETGSLNRVPPALQGKTLLTARQIEDVVAYLQTLRKDVVRPAAANSAGDLNSPEK